MILTPIFNSIEECKAWMDDWILNYRLKQQNFVVTSGGYDPIHPGHVSYLLDAVGVNPGITMMHIAVVNGDWFLSQKKGKPFMPLMDRCKIVAGIKGVKAVLAYETKDDMTVNKVLSSLKPGFFAKGGDRTNAVNIPEAEICDKNMIELITGVGFNKEWSSSDYLSKWKKEA